MVVCAHSTYRAGRWAALDFLGQGVNLTAIFSLWIFCEVTIRPLRRGCPTMLFPSTHRFSFDQSFQLVSLRLKLGLHFPLPKHGRGSYWGVEERRECCSWLLLLLTPLIWQRRQLFLFSLQPHLRILYQPGAGIQSKGQAGWIGEGEKNCACVQACEENRDKASTGLSVTKQMLCFGL